MLQHKIGGGSAKPVLASTKADQKNLTPDNQAQKDLAINSAKQSGVKINEGTTKVINATDENLDQAKKQAEQDYQSQISNAQQLEQQQKDNQVKYQQALDKYNRDKATNQVQNNAINKANADSEKAFEQHKAEVEAKNAQIDKDNAKAQADYQTALERYNKQLADYQNKKIDGNTIMSAKDVSQHLILGNEPQAKCDIQVLDTTNWKLTGSNIKSQNNLVSNNQQIAKVTYTNLKNSSYSTPDGKSHQITKEVFIYSNPINLNRLIIEGDPSQTFWYSGSEQNLGVTLDIYLYDGNGQLITATNQNPFFVSIVSLNNRTSGRSERVKINNGKPYQLDNSAVKIHNKNWLYADANIDYQIINSNGQPVDGNGMTDNPGAWDCVYSKYDNLRWYGTGIDKIENDNYISLTFETIDNGKDNNTWAKVNTTIPSTQFDMGKPTPPILQQKEKEPVYNAHKPNIPFTETEPTKPADLTLNTHNVVINYVSENYPATITYIDDTTGKTIKVDSAVGKLNQNIKFGTDVGTEIKTLEQQGYKLVSNSFSNQTYGKTGNDFQVHLTHVLTPVQRTKVITRTINYLDKQTGKSVAKQVVQEITFTQNGTKDEVIKALTWNTVKTQQFNEVVSPTVTGYSAPDIAKVLAKMVNISDDNAIVNVFYDKQQPKATPKSQTVTPVPKQQSVVNNGTKVTLPTPTVEKVQQQVPVNNLAQTNINNQQQNIILLAMASGTLTLGFVGAMKKKHE